MSRRYDGSDFNSWLRGSAPANVLDDTDDDTPEPGSKPSPLPGGGFDAGNLLPAPSGNEWLRELVATARWGPRG